MHTCKSKTMERNIIAKKGNFVLCAMVNIGRSAFISYSLLSDIDECAQGNPCNTIANSECKNTDGSYNCQCKDGFVKNGHNCEGTK